MIASAFGPSAGVQLGVRGPRIHQIHRDRFAAEFASERLGQADQRGLAHRVQREAWEDRPLGHIAADVDDPPTGPHVAHRGLGGDERRPDVDRDGLFELIQAQSLQRPEQERASVVDQDVQPTQLIGDPVNRVDYRRRVGTVRLHSDSAPSGVLDPVHHVVSALLIPLERQRHIGALLGQAQRHSGADATTTAGDQSYLAVKCFVHRRKALSTKGHPSGGDRTPRSCHRTAEHPDSPRPACYGATAAGKRVGDSVVLTVDNVDVTVTIVGEAFNVDNDGMQVVTDIATLRQAAPELRR